MSQEFNLQKYLTCGVETIVKTAIKATLSNPQESLFMAKYALASKEASLVSAMDLMKKKKVLFGASVTVTTANLKEVTSDVFLSKLVDSGCKAVFFVEFVPVTEEVNELAPGDEERGYLKKKLMEIRSQYGDIVFVSFPGDEKTPGGCLAAGRGFFHINSHGGAEPCPFSPYSDINVKDTSVREALKSKLFQGLQTGQILMEEHAGGCVLFERRDQVEELLINNTSYLGYQQM